MKYYKITNKKENHYEMQYKTGLNVDVKPFNPSGNCKEGGLYFASEDILAFLGVGEWIREVTLPEKESIYKDVCYCTKYKAHKIVLGERRKITLKVIKELINEGANIHAGEDKSLCWASHYGYTEIVEFLLDKGADIHTQEDYPLRCACYQGCVGVVRLLLERGSDIHAHGCQSLTWASERGHIEVVKVLKEHLAKENKKEKK